MNENLAAEIEPEMVWQFTEEPIPGVYFQYEEYDDGTSHQWIERTVEGKLLSLTIPDLVTVPFNEIAPELQLNDGQLLHLIGELMLSGHLENHLPSPPSTLTLALPDTGLTVL